MKIKPSLLVAYLMIAIQGAFLGTQGWVLTWQYWVVVLTTVIYGIALKESDK